MSETRLTYIPCAAGINAQADCGVVRHGSLVRFIGHGTMDFAPADAIDLAKTVALIAVECGYRNPDDIARFSAFWRRLAVECGWVYPIEDDSK